MNTFPHNTVPKWHVIEIVAQLHVMRTGPGKMKKYAELMTGFMRFLGRDLLEFWVLMFFSSLAYPPFLFFFLQ